MSARGSASIAWRGRGERHGGLRRRRRAAGRSRGVRVHRSRGSSRREARRRAGSAGDEPRGRDRAPRREGRQRRGEPRMACRWPFVRRVARGRPARGRRRARVHGAIADRPGGERATSTARWPSSPTSTPSSDHGHVARQWFRGWRARLAPASRRRISIVWSAPHGRGEEIAALEPRGPRPAGGRSRRRGPGLVAARLAHRHLSAATGERGTNRRSRCGAHRGRGPCSAPPLRARA
jgi:hypothetical protein